MHVKRSLIAILLCLSPLYALDILDDTGENVDHSPDYIPDDLDELLEFHRRGKGPTTLLPPERPEQEPEPGAGEF